MAGRRAAPQRRDAQSNQYDILAGITPVGTGDWIRLGLYSYPGWGKTSLAGTAAEAGRTLIIHSSLSLLPSRILKLPNLEHFLADNWEQMLEVQEYLRMSQHPYLWVWWDCVSIDQDVLLDDVWDATVAEKPARAYQIGADGKPGKPNLSPTSGLDRGEYGRNMERIQQWIRHMVGANSFHFGVTFHPHEGQHPTNDEGGSLLRPYVQGRNMTEKICGYMNMVAFLEVIENDDKDLKWRRLHVAENSRFYAKDQYDAFLPKGYTDNPTIPKIMRAIEGARGKPLGGTYHTTNNGPRRRGRREQ